MTITEKLKLRLKSALRTRREFDEFLDILFSSISGGGDFEETYETVSKNLKTFPYALTYTSGKLTRIEYTTDVGTIRKDFTYTGDLLTQIELSGDIPSGIKTKKAFDYDVSNVLTSISYT